MAKISYQTILTIPAGPQTNVTGEIVGDTYSKSDLILPAQTNNVPGSASIALSAGDAKKIVAMAVTTDKDSYSKDVEFKLDAQVTALKLEAPFIVVGSAATQLITTDPDTLVFTNKTAKSVKIEILVARNAVA